MALIRASGLDALMGDLQSLAEDMDEVCTSMLSAGAEAAEECWREGIRQAGHIDTGAMLSSVGSNTKVQKGVRMVEIYPQGEDSKGVRNVEKAYILHYGTSRRPGDRFVDKIDDRAEERAEIAMKNVYEDFLKSKNF